MMKNRVTLKIAEIISTWFWFGKIPWAPGTFGTLATVPFVYALSLSGPIFYMSVTLISVFIGIFAADMYESTLGKHDSSEIVIDEVVGLMIAMTWLPMTWQSLVLGFVLFRIFDILKPFPISWLDEKVKGGLGVMIDDVAAGVITNIILQVLYSKTDWLGAQLIYVAS
jgi:phosphatidylglycerophosphatase A